MLPQTCLLLQLTFQPLLLLAIPLSCLLTSAATLGLPSPVLGMLIPTFSVGILLILFLSHPTFAPMLEPQPQPQPTAGNVLLAGIPDLVLLLNSLGPSASQ